MKLKLKHLLSASILIAFAPTLIAQDEPGGGSEEVKKIAMYLKNLGTYFGYDLNQYCQTGGACNANTGATNATSSLSAANLQGGTSAPFSNSLVDKNSTYSAQLNLYYTYLGALLGGVGTESNPSRDPIPIVANSLSNNTGLSNYLILNTMAGVTYSKPPYSANSAQSVSVSPLIDQQTYQSDPVSQAILNLISTADNSYNSAFCAPNSIKRKDVTCPYLTRENIIQNVIGPLPTIDQVFTGKINQKLVPQLNMNTLISPLFYTTNNSPTQSSSPGGSPIPAADNSNSQPGLPNNSQAQQAENFIRYATAGVMPLTLPDWNTYSTLINTALNYKGDIPEQAQQQARNKLSTYMTKLRIYAAQVSIPISNFYYIMSKRLPQSPPQSNQGGASNANQTSQALNEYIMASWRLYNPQATGTESDPGQKQWLNQINKASSATVQKEMAVLLAEINYQVYLMRQQQERLLLTNSMLLLQYSMMMQPNTSALTDPNSMPNDGGSN